LTKRSGPEPKPPFGRREPRAQANTGDPPKFRLGMREAVADSLNRLGLSMGFPEELVSRGMRLLRSGDTAGLRAWRLEVLCYIDRYRKPRR